MWCGYFADVFLHFRRTVLVRELPVYISKKSVIIFSHVVSSVLSSNVIINGMVSIIKLSSVLTFTHVFNKIGFVRCF